MSCSLSRKSSGRRRSGPGSMSSSAPLPGRGGGRGRRGGRRRRPSPLPSDPLPVCGHGDVGKGSALARRRLVVVDVSVNMFGKFQQSPIYSGRCLLPLLRQSGGHSGYATETGTVVTGAVLGLGCFPARYCATTGPHGPESAETCGASTGAVLGQGRAMPVVNDRCLWSDSAENCGFSAVAVRRRGRRHLCRGAETVSHGPVQDHRAYVAVH